MDAVLKRGFLSPADLLSVSAFDGKRDDEDDWDGGIAEGVRERNLLSPEELTRALAVQLWERVLNLLGWFEGRYAVQPGPPPPQSPFSLPPPLPIPGFFGEMEALLLSGHSPHSGTPADLPFSPHGTLRGVGGASVFFALAHRRGTGKLLFERGQRRKLFELQNGTVLSAASSDPGETLGDILLRWRYLPADVLQKMEGIARSRGKKFRDLLREANLLSEEEISSALVTLHTERILEAFSWRSGTYEFRGSLREAETGAAPLQESGSYSDRPTSIRERERTERDLVLLSDSFRETAARLLEAFPSSPRGVLRLIEIPPRESLRNEAAHLATCWHESAGGRTAIVSIAPVDPPTEEVEKFGAGVDLLSASSASLPMLLERYDRVVILERDACEIDDGAALFIVSRNGTEKSALLDRIESVGREKAVGFLFRNDDREGTWQAIRDPWGVSRTRTAPPS